MHAVRGFMQHYGTNLAYIKSFPRKMLPVSLLLLRACSPLFPPDCAGYRCPRKTYKKSSPQIEISRIYYLPLCQWRLWWHFPIHIIVLKCHRGKEFRSVDAHCGLQRMKTTDDEQHVSILLVLCRPSVWNRPPVQCDSKWQSQRHVFVLAFPSIASSGSM